MASNAAGLIHTSDSKVATIGGRGIDNSEKVPMFKRHHERENFSNVRDPSWHSASSNFRSPPASSLPLPPSPSIYDPRQRPNILFSRRSSETNSPQADIQQAKGFRPQEILDPRSAKSQWLSHESLPLPPAPRKSKAYGREYSPNGRLFAPNRSSSAAADYSSFKRPSARYPSVSRDDVLQPPGSSSTSLRPAMGDPRSTSLTLASEMFMPNITTRHDTMDSTDSKSSLLRAAQARYLEGSSPSLSAPPSPSSLARRRACPTPDNLSGRTSLAGRFSRKQYSNTDLQSTRRELLRLEGPRSESPHSLLVPSADDHSSYNSRRPSVSSSSPSRSTNNSSSDRSQAQQSDNKDPNVCEDAQADLHFHRKFDRSTSSRSNDYTPEAFRKLHGRLIPSLDLDEQRPPTHSRPPITARTSTQYSKVSGLDSSQWPSEAGRTVPLSRWESYSSAMSISPVGEVRPREGRYMHGYPATMDSKVNPRNASPHIHKNTSPHTHRNPSPHTHRNVSARTQRNPSPHTTNVHTRVRQIDGVNSHMRSLGVRPSPISIPYYSNHDAQVATSVERREMDDFQFLKTIETTDPPYIPDKFAVDDFLSEKKTVALWASRGKSSTASLGRMFSETDCPHEPAGEEDFSFSRFKPPSFPGARPQSTATANEIGPHYHEVEEITPAPAKEEIDPAPAKEVVSEPAITNGATTATEPPRLQMDSYTRSTSSIESYSETCAPAHYISNAYRETGTVLRQTLNSGWSAAYESYKERRTLERSYRYGKTSKKAKIYMSRAPPTSNEKAAIDQTLEPRKSADEKLEPATMAYGESFTNERANANAIGDPMTASSTKDTAATFQASPEKKSAFVEHFNGTEQKDMSDDKVAESSKRKLFPTKWRLQGKRG